MEKINLPKEEYINIERDRKRLAAYDNAKKQIEKMIGKLKESSDYPHNFKGQMVEDFEWVLSLMDSQNPKEEKTEPTLQFGDEVRNLNDDIGFVVSVWATGCRVAYDDYSARTHDIDVIRRTGRNFAKEFRALAEMIRE